MICGLSPNESETKMLQKSEKEVAGSKLFLFFNFELVTRSVTYFYQLRVSNSKVKK